MLLTNKLNNKTSKPIDIHKHKTPLENHLLRKEKATQQSKSSRAIPVILVLQNKYTEKVS